MVDLYAAVYGHERTTARTFINDNVVVCVLESILTHQEDDLIAAGAGAEVIDGRVGFQTHRHVTAFLSANQTTPGIAAELFFLDFTPRLD
jgi:hypothetical protein